MPPESEGNSSWDFSDAHKYLSETLTPFLGLQKLSKAAAGSAFTNHDSQSNGNEHVAVPKNSKSDASLGDFDLLWRSLNLPPEGSIPKLPDNVRQIKANPAPEPFKLLTASARDEHSAYASDGAFNYNPHAKRTKWADEDDPGALTSFQPATQPRLGGLGHSSRLDQDTSPSHAIIQRRAKKKKNKTAKKSGAREPDTKCATLIEGDGAYKVSDDVLYSPQLVPTSVVRPSITKKGPDNRRNHSLVDNATNPCDVAQNPLLSGASNYREAADNGGRRNERSSLAPMHVNGGKKYYHELLADAERKARIKCMTNAIKATNLSKNDVWPVADPFTELQKSLAKPHRTQTLEELCQDSMDKAVADISKSGHTLTTDKEELGAALTRARKVNTLHSGHSLQPLKAHDRQWNLFKKIIRHFPDSKKDMIGPIRLGPDKLAKNGLHIFIDASNIFIGFHEQLKRARGLSDSLRVPRAYPGFASLALLLERRREVTKRTIVGSTPYVPIFDEAKACGYELNILEKVYKAREPTERQQFFAARDAKRKSRHNGISGGDSSDAAPGDAIVALTTEMKWVEQGVDEVLHNKMGESLADTKDPPRDAIQRPTAVLATGDAQEAEYSSGFGAWAVRMLEHGWNVEIASWSTNTSQMYYEMERRQGWPGYFRIIELDEFVEDLYPNDEDQLGLSL